MKRVVIAGLLVALCAGCAAYRWTSGVPEGMRTVKVPVFRNATDLTELGPAAAREVAREFMREGTFRLAGDDAAVEVQGEIVKAKRGAGTGDRQTHMRLNEYPLAVTVRVSAIDRRNGRVLLDNREFVARTTFVTGNDLLTGERDAAGRLASDLAQQVVDAVLDCKW